MGGRSGSNGQNEIGTEDELSGWRGTVTGINRVAYMKRVKPPYIPPCAGIYFYGTISIQHTSRVRTTHTPYRTPHTPPAPLPAAFSQKGPQWDPVRGRCSACLMIS